MRIAEVTLTNWTRYRGSHTATFGDGVHAVVATHETVDGRSNWLGKSSFMWAVSMFALYGIKMQGHRYEDDWITNGEDSGGVVVKFSNGLSVSRNRKRGSSTKLTVEWQGVTSIGKRAQEIIETVVRMTKDDFASAFYFEQKMMNALILAGSTKLHEKARAWFELERLQAAFEHAKSVRKELQSRESALTATLKQSTGASEVSHDYLQGLESMRVAAHKNATKLQAEVDGAAAWVSNDDDAHEYDKILSTAVELKRKIADSEPKELKALAASSRYEFDSASVELKLASTQLAERRKLSNGEFDGECPLMRKACPSYGLVIGVLGANTSLVSGAEERHTAAVARHAGRKENLARSTQSVDKCKRLIDEFKACGRSAVAKKPAKDYIVANGHPPESAGLRARSQEAWVADGSATAELRAARKAAIHAEERDNARKVAEAGLKDTSRLIGLQTQAMAVFKRAQRTIAEAAVSEIERDSNSLLNEAGIDLSVVVGWERPVKGLAAHCEVCGYAFGNGQRAKSCPSCATARAQKRKDELEIVPSNRSGAADDLAGVAFQLGVAAWLKRKRQSPWSVAFIDEPFSACDSHNRAALAVQLNTILNSRFGFEQAFITAHDRSVLDAIPERFEITADDKGSAFK